MEEGDIRSGMHGMCTLTAVSPLCSVVAFALLGCSSLCAACKPTQSVSCHSHHLLSSSLKFKILLAAGQ